MHRFTTEDLLLYLYGETSIEKTSAIKAALEKDWNLRSELELLSSTIAELDTMICSPSTNTVDKLLAYATKPSLI